MSVDARVEELLGSAVKKTLPLGGGCIADVSRLDLADGRQVVAKRGAAGLELEGWMLSYLAGTGGLTVPEVYHASDELLLIAYLPDEGRMGPAAEEDAARQIAALHSITAEAFGFERETVIAGLPQSNEWTESWPEFFAGQRLLPMARLAHHRGHLDGQTLASVEQLVSKLDQLLAPGPPALLHGDLWGGNILVLAGNKTAYIDPAIYYGHAEVELAFATLFGSLGEAFFGAYQEIRPIAPGFFETRRDLYNLYPLLVHSAFFGGHYARAPSAATKTASRSALAPCYWPWPASRAWIPSQS